MTLENMNGSLTRSEHGTDHDIFDINVISMFLCCLTLADTLKFETGVDQIFSYLKCSVFLALETMCASDLCKFHIKFSDCVSNQHELTLSEYLWIRRGRFEVRVDVQVDCYHVFHGFTTHTAHFAAMPKDLF